MGEAMTYEFKYTGDLLDAIHHCYKNVLGASYPDFNIELKEHRRT
jgi:hypothetical protein